MENTLNSLASLYLYSRAKARVVARTPAWLALIMLWALALIPRLVVSLVFINYPIALDDMYQYDMLGRSLAEGKGYRWYSSEDVDFLKPYLSQFMQVPANPVPRDGLITTFRAPGYPLFLSYLYSLVAVDSRIALTRLVQVFLSASMAPMVYLLALRLGFRRRIALVSGFWMALYPILIFYPVGLASENLFIPLLLLSMLAMFWSAGSDDLRKTFITGLLLGALMLTRSILAPFVALASVWLWRSSRQGWRGGMVLFLTAFGLCLPWSIRNSMLMGKPAFTENTLGYNLYVGYHPQGNGGFISEIAVSPMYILDDAARDRYCTTQALQFIHADPLEALTRIPRRASFFFGLEDRELIYFYSNNFFGRIPQPWLILAYILIVAPWVGASSFTIAGLAFSPRQSRKWLVAGLLLSYTLPHILILAEPRFHLALVPVSLPFAAYGLLQMKQIRNSILVPSPAEMRTAWLIRLSLLALLLLIGWGFATGWGKLFSVMTSGGNGLHLSY